MNLREYAKQQAQEVQTTQETQQAHSLSRTQEQQAAAKEQAAAVYEIYQNNIKTVYQLEADILKGLRSGNEIKGLFLKAIKALSLTTGNELFYRQAAEDLKENYK